MSATPLLEMRGVRVEADGEPVIADLDLALSPGESVAVVGPPGCGKTTLLRVAAGLEPPALGVVTLRAARPAFIFRDGGLISNASVADNLLLPLFYQGLDKSAGLPKVEAALAEFGLAAHAGERPGALVQETRQLVQLARAAALECDLLMFEEPGAMRSASASAKVRNWLSGRLAAGKLALMASATDPASLGADFSGRIIRLTGGELESA